MRCLMVLATAASLGYGTAATGSPDPVTPATRPPATGSPSVRGPVIRPPASVDPGMKVIRPATHARMPVIRPPTGTPDAKNTPPVTVVPK